MSSTPEVEFDGMKQLKNNLPYWLSEAVTYVFSIKQPRDLFQGVSKGLGNIIMGTLLGASVVISSPYLLARAGYEKSGILGATKGLAVGMGIGIAGGTTLILSGTVTGIFQMGRGLLNTPFAIRETYLGNEWDNEKNCWIEHDLPECYKKLGLMTDDEFISQSAKSNSSFKSSAKTSISEAKVDRVVKDKALYNILGVEPNATSSEIKRAYHLQARKYHPDKNLNDPNAIKIFQSIGAAYQILGDEQRRASYDTDGGEAIDNNKLQDASTIYSIFFGSDKFDEMFGELSLLTNAQLGLKNPNLLPFRQLKREITCASTLVSRLQHYSFSNTTPEEFATKVKEDITELCGTAFGSSLLHLIGEIYAEEARKQLHSPLAPSILSLKVTSTIRSYRELAKFLYSGIAFGRSAVTFMELNNELNDKVQRITIELEQEMELSQLNNDDGDEDGEGQLNAQGTRVSGSGGGGGGGGTVPSVSSLQESVRDATSEDRKQLDAVLMGGLRKSAELMWWMIVSDLRLTVSKASRLVLRDSSIDEATRRGRAQVLLALGELYMSESKGDIDHTVIIEEALMKLAVREEGLSDFISNLQSMNK